MKRAATFPDPRRRPQLLAGVGLLLAGTAIVCAWLQSRPSPPPIPTPPGLARLDSQVRDHLARVAEAVAAEPRDPDRRAELGLAFAVNGLWNEARHCFLDAQALGSREPLPAVYAAVALQETGEVTAALKELQAAVRQFPNSAPAWHRLGTVAVSAGDFGAALEAFTRVTELAPNLWQGWAGVGEVLLRQADPAKAVPALERALAIDPLARSPHHLLARAYRAVGRAAEAEREGVAGAGQTIGPLPDEWSARALPHMKSLPDLFGRADTFQAQGRGGDAVVLLREAFRFHPADLTVACRLAGALVAAEQLAEAQSVLVPFLLQQPDNATLQVAAAAVAAAAGRPGEALVHAERAAALAPDLAEAQVARANALLAEEKDALAAEALAGAVRRSPRNVGLLVQLGDLQRQNLARPAAALALYSQALAIDPLQPPAWERLAELQLELGNVAEADRALGELRRMAPTATSLAGLERRLRERKDGP
jgi:tetratricopeptide (TPR) repeat protein